MSDKFALRAGANEIEDKVYGDLARLKDTVSPEVAAEVSLAVVAGAARAFRLISAESLGPRAETSALQRAIAGDECEH